MSRILYLKNRDPDLHLRDARHAHQLFTEHNFALAPKVKFLYHVNFALTTEAQSLSPNSTLFGKEIAVLAKSADLPSYRATVETKNQYNRKKNIQTRVDYNEVSIRFHDDNTGITRAMLEEYYKYNVVDGRRENVKEVNPRDKYSQTVNRYGLDNQTTVPFFSYIKLYQLSRQQWFSYTLVNPIITQWSHDSVDSSDGQGIMENSISVAYESVFYDNGTIQENSEPAGFASQETRYDFTPSPLTTFNGRIPGGNSLPPSPKLANVRFQNESPIIDRYSNNASLRGSGSLNFREEQNLPGVIPQTRIPKNNTQTIATLSTTNDRSVKSLDSDTIKRELNRNPQLLSAFTKKILAIGGFGAEWNSRNFNQFDKLSKFEQVAITNSLLERLDNDRKSQQIASQLISTNKGR
jgi:hypothetical protein